MKLTVAAFFQHMPPYSGAAALRGKSIIANLAKLLPHPGSGITVYSTTPDPSPIEGAEVRTLNVPEVENSLSLKRRLWGEIRMGYAAAKCMYRGPDKPDLALVSSPGYVAALVQTFFARRLGVPYILEMRDIYPQVYAEAKLLPRHSWLYRLLGRLSRTMYEGAELVLCATRGLAREVARESPTARVTHVYNGFPASLAQRLSSKHSRFTVCFHGVLGFFQDIETLLEVAEKLGHHEVDVLVIGYGRKEGPLLESKLPNLRFLGRQPFDQTIAEVERCHLGLCLRLDDGISKDAFPVKVWEYLGLGIPTIVTPPCEAGDFLQEHHCGEALPSGDTDGIVASVLKAKNDAGHLETMAANCRQLAAQYTREQTGLAAAREIHAILSQRTSPVFVER